jgi:uncharacterized circularly permuted ATP-grasp superfamily protein
MDAENVDTQWALEREIVLSRVFDAPRELVFEAWTDPEGLAQWFGPRASSRRRTRSMCAWVASDSRCARWMARPIPTELSTSRSKSQSAFSRWNLLGRAARGALTSS